MEKLKRIIEEARLTSEDSSRMLHGQPQTESGGSSLTDKALNQFWRSGKFPYSEIPILLALLAKLKLLGFETVEEFLDFSFTSTEISQGNYNLEKLRQQIGISVEKAAQAIGVTLATWENEFHAVSLGVAVDFITAIGGRPYKDIELFYISGGWIIELSRFDNRTSGI